MEIGESGKYMAKMAAGGKELEALCKLPDRMVRTTFTEILLNLVETDGDRPFLTMKKGTETIRMTCRDFAESLGFLDAVCRTKKQDTGALKGGRVVLLEPRREYSVFWICAAMVYGAAAVPLNPDLPKEDLEDMIESLDPSLVVIPGSAADAWKESLPEELRDRVVCSELFDTAEKTGRLPQRGIVSPEDTAVIVFTSGTTGKQKGAMIDHANFFANSMAPAYVFEHVFRDNRMYSILPYYHVFGVAVDLFIVLMSRSELYLGRISMDIAKEIRQNRCTIVSVVPAMLDLFRLLLRQAAAAMPGCSREEVKNRLFGEDFRYMTCGGAFLDPEKRKEIESYGFRIFQGYGLTECTSHITSDSFAGTKEGALGMIHPWMDYRLVDGELQVRGAGVMSGYWKKPMETAEILRDGWLCTGDLGEVDKDRFFYYKGRKKNILIADNGENVSPEPIENRLTVFLGAKEVRVREGQGGLHVDLHFAAAPGFSGGPAGGAVSAPEYLEERLREYNKKRPMFLQIRTYSLYPDGLEKNAVGKILRQESRICEQERHRV